MYAKTHVLAGAIAGYLVYPSFLGVGAGMFGGLLSDIDEPESYIGRLFLIISIPLKWTLKHRTVTHSLLFLLAMILVTIPISAYFYSWKLSLAFGAGILTHMIGDMMTGQIKLFWPHQKSYGIKMPFWLYRIVDGSVRIFLVLFIGYHLIASNVFSKLIESSFKL
ncbi:metal-dependent hydrolase [Paenibacillus sp. Leaf72]|uniref:metal-dependent hydrolase n=1 Tax=Paenibacillus sp. Leaf72 TaxID=1736234 RepID=UPI0006F6605E|nr:metal-dependent hydrolase [Paenibacillus sp. Leaf72]KQN97039.1 hypothetical protein ASF12_23505 [Paenibacillus sp. Leaf72]